MRLIACVLMSPALLCGQLPQHAVQLNSSGSFIPPFIAQSGDAVVAVGSNGQNLSVCFARSPDGGRTWPIRDMPLAPGSRCEALCAAGDRFFALVSNPGLHLFRSLDAGMSWSSSLLDAGPVLSGAGIAVQGNTLVVAWKNGGVLVSRSVDGGSTWSPAQRIDANLASSFGIGPIEVAIAGSQVNVAWDCYTGPSTPQVVHQRSLDGGATWLGSAQTLLPTLLAGMVGDGPERLIAGVGSSLLRSVDAGATWTTVTGHGIAQMEDLAADGPFVLAVGTTGQLPNLSYLLSVSLDSGATWLPGPYVLPTFATWRTSAFVFGDVMLVQWRPGWASTTGIVIQSDDFGQHWRAVTGVSSLYNENVLPSADRWIVTANAPGSGVTSAYVLVGHTLRGTGTPGSGGLEPSLAAVGLPSLGRTFRLEVKQARGGAPGLLAFSPAGPGSLSLGAATLWIQMPVISLPFVTGGLPNAPGAGIFTHPVPVPASTSFAGLSFASQAFVLDPAAGDGFTATRAIETWLH